MPCHNTLIPFQYRNSRRVPTHTNGPCNSHTRRTALPHGATQKLIMTLNFPFKYLTAINIKAFIEMLTTAAAIDSNPAHELFNYQELPSLVSSSSITLATLFLTSHPSPNSYRDFILPICKPIACAWLANSLAESVCQKQSGRLYPMSELIKPND